MLPYWGKSGLVGGNVNGVNIEVSKDQCLSLLPKNLATEYKPTAAMFQKCSAQGEPAAGLAAAGPRLWNVRSAKSQTSALESLLNKQRKHP